MSEASSKLERSRQAIVEQLRRNEPRRGASTTRKLGNRQPQAALPMGPGHIPPGPAGIGWTRRLRSAGSTWWRHHPAHMALEVLTPFLSDYAQRRPGRFLAVAAVVGAAVVVARPWKLLSVTGILVAVLKSSQVSTLVMSAMSAADYQRDEDRQR